MVLTLTLPDWTQWLMQLRAAPSATSSASSVAAEDARVIEAILSGDRSMYEVLVNKYQSGALGVAYSLLGNYEDAKDVSQEAFVSAYQSLSKFQGQSKFSTWLYRIVVNKCKDLYRSRSRRPMAWLRVGPTDAETFDDHLFIDVADTKLAPETQIKSKEISKQLTQAIQLLPLKQRTAFVLHHVQGMTLAEVSQVMHIRLGTVKTHVFRATEFVRNELASLMEESK